MLAACAFAVGGCESTAPSARQLSRVDTLVTERTGAAFDAASLLAIDPSVAPVPPVGELTIDDAVRRALAHNLALVADAEDFSDAVALGAVAGRAAFFGEPGLEVHDSDGVFDGNVDGGDADGVEAFGDAGDPVFSAE